MAQSRAAAAATPVRNIRDRFLFMKAPPEKSSVDGSDRLALASPVFVPNGFEDDAGADGQYAQDMGLVKKVLKSSRERDSARAEVGFRERAEDHGEQHGEGWGNPALSIR